MDPLKLPDEMLPDEVDGVCLWTHTSRNEQALLRCSRLTDRT